MKRQDYFPTRIGDQIVCLRNFKLKLPVHATTLGLVAADVTNILLDVDTAIYGLAYIGDCQSPGRASSSRCACAIFSKARTSAPGATGSSGR